MVLEAKTHVRDFCFYFWLTSALANPQTPQEAEVFFPDLSVEGEACPVWWHIPAPLQYKEPVEVVWASDQDASWEEAPGADPEQARGITDPF